MAGGCGRGAATAAWSCLLLSRPGFNDSMALPDAVWTTAGRAKLWSKFVLEQQ